MTILGGIFMAVGGLGVFAAGPPLAFLSERFGWRSALVAVALFSVLMAVADRLVIRDRPAAARDAQRRAPSALRLGAAFREVLGAGRFWPLAAWGGLSAGVTFAIGGMWGAPYLQHVHGMSKARAGGYQSMFGLALLLGAPAIAALANRAGRKPVAVGGTSLQILCLAVLAAFPRQVPGPALYPLFFCLYLAGNTNGPLGAVMARELFRPAIAGTAMGLVNFFPFLLGGLYQVLMGAVLDRGGRSGEAYTAAGYRWIFLLGLASAVLALAASLLIRETLPSSRRPAGGTPRPEMEI